MVEEAAEGCASAVRVHRTAGKCDHADVTYLDEQDPDEMTTVRVTVRVRWVRHGDDSPRARHKIRAWFLMHLASWRGMRSAAAYGWPGVEVVEWFPTHMDSTSADEMVRAGSEAMSHVDREYRSATGGMWAVDVWDGAYLTTFTPRMHW